MLAVDQVRGQPFQLGRVLDLVLRLVEDDAEHPELLAQFLQQMAVVHRQLVAVQPHQTGPVISLGDG